MNKQNGNIFTHALKDIKRSHTKTTVNKANNEDMIIDFDEESEKLGEDIQTINFSSKIKSAVVKTNQTPYPVSLKARESDKPNSRVTIIKSQNGSTKIILNKKSSNNENDNTFDLCNELHSKAYIVFIRNLSTLMTETKLKEIFSQYGFIISAKIDRGTAEIRYFRKENALKAIEATNGFGFFGKIIKASYYEEEEGNKELKDEGFNKDRSDSKNKVNNIKVEKRDSIWGRIKFNN
jgi:RNA recognition motif-containing protein